jgi:hypothetical protein
MFTKVIFVSSLISLGEDLMTGVITITKALSADPNLAACKWAIGDLLNISVQFRSKQSCLIVKTGKSLSDKPTSYCVHHHNDSKYVRNLGYPGPLDERKLSILGYKFEHPYYKKNRTINCLLYVYTTSTKSHTANG